MLARSGLARRSHGINEFLWVLDRSTWSGMEMRLLPHHVTVEIFHSETIMVSKANFFDDSTLTRAAG